MRYHAIQSFSQIFAMLRFNILLSLCLLILPAFVKATDSAVDRMTISDFNQALFEPILQNNFAKFRSQFADKVTINEESGGSVIWSTQHLKRFFDYQRALFKRNNIVTIKVANETIKKLGNRAAIVDIEYLYISEENSQKAHPKYRFVIVSANTQGDNSSRRVIKTWRLYESVEKYHVSFNAP